MSPDPFFDYLSTEDLLKIALGVVGEDVVVRDAGLLPDPVSRRAAVRQVHARPWFSPPRLGRRLGADADGLVQLVGQPGDLLDQLSVLREHLQMLLGHRSLAAQHLGLAHLEVLLALDLGVVMVLQGRVADLVAFGLTGCGEQNQGAA